MAVKKLPKNIENIDILFWLIDTKHIFKISIYRHHYTPLSILLCTKKRRKKKGRYSVVQELSNEPKTNIIPKKLVEIQSGAQEYSC